MKTFVKLLGVAMISGMMISGGAAKADTAYHSVYEAPITKTDAFSLLDKYGNNVLTPEEYNNAANARPFNEVDTNKDGFISRSEFYASQRMSEDGQNTEDLNQLQPAAGGDMQGNDCVYNDAKSCEVRPY
jgi:hypothetical protein